MRNEEQDIVVIGLGNQLRNDDGAGLEVARRLKLTLPHGRVITECDDPLAIIAAWENAHTAVVLDALRSNSPPGSIHRFEANEHPLPRHFARCSSHGQGLPDAVELARALGLLPRRLIVYAIEGQDFGKGSDLSPAVAVATNETVARVANELAELRGA